MFPHIVGQRDYIFHCLGAGRIQIFLYEVDDVRDVRISRNALLC